MSRPGLGRNSSHTGLSQTFGVDGLLTTATEFAASRSEATHDPERHRRQAEATVQGRLQGSPFREELTSRDVLVIDEAGMVGSRQMERVLSAAQKVRAKVVLVGDPEQLQAIEAGAAFRALAERHGAGSVQGILKVASRLSH